MSHFLEPLESRMLLSVSPAVATLHTDEATIKTDLKALIAAGAAALKTIKADLKDAAVQSVVHSQEKALSTVMTHIGAAVSKAISAASSKVNADVTKFEALSVQVIKNRDPKIAAKFSAAENSLTTAASAGLAAFNSADSGQAIVAALNAIIYDGGTTSTDASNALASLSSHSQTMSAAASQTFSSDVATIVGP